MATPRKKPEELLPRGRPSLYKPEYCERVIELGKQGCSPMEIAADLDIDRATLYHWSDKYPDFLTSLKRAKVYEQAWWEKMGKSGLTADRFNAMVWSKSVAARFREDYTERKEVSGIDGGPIKTENTNKLDVSGLSLEELEALEKALIKTGAAKG
jgi:transposase-like protein